jgi:hypothetical protein
MLKRLCCGRSPAKVAEVPDDSLAPSIEVSFIVRHEAETFGEVLTPNCFPLEVLYLQTGGLGEARATP